MKPVFKTYIQNELTLFPENLDNYISKNHAVRLVSNVVNKLNIDNILSTYKGGGTSNYHPCMLLKVLFYAYMNNIFSSRKIEKALKENIYFMWLSGKQFPDFRTKQLSVKKSKKSNTRIIFTDSFNVGRTARY